MYYVYQLSFEGIIFYIGSTNRPLLRYKEHTNCTDAQTTPVIHWIIVNNKLPDFKIIYHCGDRMTAVKYEYALIQQFIDNKYKLSNNDRNTDANRLDLPVIGYSPRPKLKRNYAKHIQDYINEYNRNI